MFLSNYAAQDLEKDLGDRMEKVTEDTKQRLERLEEQQEQRRRALEERREAVLGSLASGAPEFRAAKDGGELEGYPGGTKQPAPARHGGSERSA